ncbi:hypothetical protein E1265_26205 [Streptomyces sp. 8K308]|uniref:hypothetical protein n=1 Tax=Streptomyces sp. 8K308 TaxID=2530388 RepID=UPI00105213F2|nr:hypothetical protein [Streptomyces sp. 8K308]TDC15819.1 hypothetical protein E1265_26205 [Streptomyces sp. 8K308]
MLIGASYYHEYQPYERHERDLDPMVAAGFTVIRVGESTMQHDQRARTAPGRDRHRPPGTEPAGARANPGCTRTELVDERLTATPTRRWNRPSSTPFIGGAPNSVKMYS